MTIEEAQDKDDRIDQIQVGGEFMSHGKVLGMLSYNPGETTVPSITPEQPTTVKREIKEDV